MKRLITYRNRFFIPLSLILIMLASACGHDPLEDPNSVESRAKAAADSCQATFEKVGTLFSQCSPTSNDAFNQMKSMLDAAKTQIEELTKQILLGIAPTCEAPDPAIVWRCSNPNANPSPVDTRLVLLTAQQVIAFGYPTKGCYVGVQKLSNVGSNWFFGPVPATLVNSPALPQLEFPYDFRNDPTYSSATDWLCKRVPIP